MEVPESDDESSRMSVESSSFLQVEVQVAAGLRSLSVDSRSNSSPSLSDVDLEDDEDFALARGTVSSASTLSRTSVTGAVWNVIQRNYSRDLFEVHGERAPKPWRRSEQADVKLEAQLAERIAYGRSLVVGRGVHRWQGMEDRYIYSQVEVNGVVYRAGECVAVHAPKKGASKKASIDSVVFIFILYFTYFPEDDDWFVHGLKLVHGDQTFLKVAAADDELFLIDRCESVKARKIVSKNIAIVKPDAQAPENMFFVRFAWDADGAIFYDLSDALQMPTGAAPGVICPACARRSLERARKADAERRRRHGHAFARPRLGGSRILTVETGGVEYHVGDDVFLFVEPEHVLAVARIIGFESFVEDSGFQKVRVTRYVRRCYVVPEDKLELHERELVAVPADSILVDPETLQGTATVFHEDEFGDTDRREFLLDNGRFFVKSRLGGMHSFELDSVHLTRPAWEELGLDEFDKTRCETCFKRALGFYDCADSLKSGRKAKLTAIDLFSGVGGFSEGLRQSGLFRTVAAVDVDLTATSVYRSNFPGTNVLQLDISTFVNRLVKGQYAEEIENIDVVYGSPPCGSFSVANQAKKVDDARSRLVFSFLSVVDHLKPSYFLFENVPGMVSHPISELGQQETGGLLRAVVRVALDLGYQVQFGLLNSGAYGVPQSRRRLFFAGSKLGLPMWRLPETYCAWSTTALSFDGLEDRAWSVVSNRQEGSAPHDVTSFDDATGDLPGFDIADPAVVEGPSLRPWPQFGHDVVGQSNFKFHVAKPTTAFQAFARTPRDPVLSYVVQELSAHQIAAVSALVARRIAGVPVLGNHLDLPHELALPLRDGRRQKKSHYARIDRSKPMHTLLTKVTVAGDGHGPYLHPVQNRLLSVREAARASSFTDEFVFSPSPDSPLPVSEQYKLVGNSVPPLVARAIGRSLLETIYESL